MAAALSPAVRPPAPAGWLARWRWPATQGLRAGGLPAQLALLLLAAAAAGWLLHVQPAADRIAQMQARQEVLRQRLAAPAPAPPAGPQEQLADFERRFDDARVLPAAAAQVLGLARRLGVQVDQGSFELQSSADQPLARYTMDLPLKADYRTLRRFLDALLRDQPNLALESLTLAQGEPPSAALEARVRLVLFIHKTP